MPPVSATALAAMMLLVLACGNRGGSQMSDMEGSEPKLKVETVHVKVDDRMLAGDDAFAIIEPVWDKANIYDSLEDYEKSLKRFSRPQRLVFAVHWYISEVNNGGHDQFYSNSTGIVWPDAIDGFEAIGIPEAAAIVRESSQRLGTASRERRERWMQMEKRKPTFDDLDDQFYELQKHVDIDRKILEYARERAPQFYFDGTVERAVFPKVGPN